MATIQVTAPSSHSNFFQNDPNAEWLQQLKQYETTRTSWK